MAKFKMIFILIVLVSSLLFITVSANKNETYESNPGNLLLVEKTSNFFSQKDTKEQVVYDGVIDDQFTLVSENNNIALYLCEENMSIALKDKRTNYVWYSYYLNYESYNYEGKLKNSMISGVSISYYNSMSLNETNTSILDEKNTIIEYQYKNNGFTADINFADLGLSFQVIVLINDHQLIVEIPHQSIKEVEIKKLSYKYPINNKLKSITVFPYFGSENYLINGYSFIPDGSGALIRYTETINSTAYIKRIYGDDAGIVEKTTLYDHLKDELTATLPIFGISHGFHQNAFLYEVISGSGCSEIHSYPYGYEAKINTTFVRFHTRDKYLVTLSDNETIPIINESPYPVDFRASYTFLNHEDASYVGMAKTYREKFHLKEKEKNDSIPLRLDVIGLEYKNGLFGKKYVKMTTYNDLMRILKELRNHQVNHTEIAYTSYQSSTFYDGPMHTKLGRRLGGKDDFTELIDYINTNNHALYLINDPMLSFKVSKNTIKKLNLSPLQSNLFDTNHEIYFKHPNTISQNIDENNSIFKEFNLNQIAIPTIGNYAFSFRSDGINYSRHEMIEMVKGQLSNLKQYDLGLFEANDYVFPYITSYYNAPYESNKYAFITDSIPFIQLVLSGNVNVFGPNMNFISNTHLYNLRLIEYNMYPSYVITKKETHELKYTNSEHIYTSEYQLWKNSMITNYQMINTALSKVQDAHMINHQTLDEGIIKVSYDNYVDIYINYTAHDVTVEGVSISSMNFVLKEDAL